MNWQTLTRSPGLSGLRRLVACFEVRLETAPQPTRMEIKIYETAFGKYQAESSLSPVLAPARGGLAAPARPTLGARPLAPALAAKATSNAPMPPSDPAFDSPEDALGDLLGNYSRLIRRTPPVSWTANPSF